MACALSAIVHLCHEEVRTQTNLNGHCSLHAKQYIQEDRHQAIRKGGNTRRKLCLQGKGRHAQAAISGQQAQTSVR